MATFQTQNDSNETSDSEVDCETNLLSLGADAWDDSALIDAFNKDLKLYKRSHSNQLIDLSKVSNMINFKKAKKINQNIQTHDHEDDDEEDDDDDDDEDDTSNEEPILEPSFVPFAAKNASKQNKINKYSSWPPQPTQSVQKQKKRKGKKNKKKQNRNNDTGVVETENLAKMYEAQQQKEQQQQQQQNTQQSYPHYGYPPQQQQDRYYNEYGYGRYSDHPYRNYYPQQAPPMPPMPPYMRSGMFNMGLNMMAPPAMSNKPTRDEALANMLLAWYWNGYYAGYEAAKGHNK